MAKSNGIKSLKQAAKLLNKHSPDGESLAYINPEEAKLLRASGGSGIMTLQGVPSYAHGPWWNPFQWHWADTEEDGVVTKGLISKGKTLLGYDDRVITKGDKEYTVPGRSIVQDAMSIWIGLRAKKEQEGLNEAEMEQFNKLNQQLTAAKTEFDVSSDFGAQLKAPTNVASTVSDVAAYSPIDFSGSATPDLTTTAVAQGGRIGAFNGGIQGLMPQQGMPQQGMPQQGMPQQGMPQQGMPQPGLMPPQGLDPRMGYAAQGGRIGYADGTEFVDKIYSDEARTLAGNIPEVRKSDSQYYPTLFEEREKGEWKYPGEPRPGQEYLTSTLQGANTILDKMEMQKLRLTELASEQGLDFNNLFERELNRITETEGPATQDITRIKDRERVLNLIERKLEDNVYAQGGRIGAQGGGIMPLLDMGGMEKDYRQDGGFVPIGRKEKADDVPARLSKNEFVFTADAVKAAGGGDIDEGAQRMYNVMKNLEAGGEISEQSQGQA